MPRVTLRTLFVTVVVTIATVQLVAVTLAALPPNRYSDAAAPHTGYLSPYFTQNWRLFAPNPVSDDRSVRFQGSYVAPDGSTKQTDWVDWTDVELDLVHHRLVGGRAGYITNKLYGPLGVQYRALGTASRAVIDTTTQEDPLGWAALATSLRDAGARPAATSGFLRYERATARLASDVLGERWPDLELTAVRYSLRSQAVVPYAARSGSDTERAAARPAPTERISGWRVPDAGDAAERRSVADFDRRHR